MTVSIVITGLIGYLLGSIPCGYLIARSHGVDIFSVGSKSPGATNVRRVLGGRAGNLVFLLDFLKGVLATALALILGRHLSPECPLPPGEYQAIAGLLGALAGHSFSCFTRFRGGKGVATGAGGFLVLLPLVVLVAGLLWIVTFKCFRYVSLASIIAALSLPATGMILGHHSPLLELTWLIAAFVLFRHRENIRRLLNRTENRFSKKP